MKKEKASQRRQARTRLTIIQAASEIIETQGPDGLNMRDVAERSDYSPSNLYEYFSGKDELLAAVIKEAFAHLTTYVRQTTQGLSPRERLQSYGHAYLAFARTHPQLYLLIFAHKVVPSEAHTEETPSPYSLLREIVEEGIVQGVFIARANFGLQEMTFGCWSLVHGMAMLRLTAHEGNSKDSLASDDQILACFIDGLSEH